MKKERERIQRPFLVCWDEYKCIGWKTESELRELIEQSKVDWFKHREAQNPTIVKRNE